ncbi:hypothetical protein [uncultured Ornithinimicrobium sp.]|uniref:hypothetical protein n=1 Tax=uncultured Ornithinimicrobium sp. TaxID=259307 RepID=UPI002598182B|nr:hypothetical protein [uncultured Ornithinimicrobium sp.]
MGLAGCDADEVPAPQDFADATVAPGEAADRTAPAPDGWTLRQSAGFSIATPPGWQPRPEDQRVHQAAMDVGVPFTGQPTPPPRLLVFLERGHVGEIDLREQVLRMQLASSLPADATLDTSTEVEVAGADRAVEFDVFYTTAEVRSLTDTPMHATRVRQVELLVETEGLPKFGFRYAAPVSEFDEEEWERIRSSIQVRPDEVRDLVDVPGVVDG